jgi:hypothetical protein
MQARFHHYRKRHVGDGVVIGKRGCGGCQANPPSGSSELEFIDPSEHHGVRRIWDDGADPVAPKRQRKRLSVFAAEHGFIARLGHGAFSAFQEGIEIVFDQGDTVPAVRETRRGGQSALGGRPHTHRPAGASQRTTTGQGPPCEAALNDEDPQRR